jgi:hypothetical protein
MPQSMIPSSKNPNAKGHRNGILEEKLLDHNKAPSEVVYKGHNNSYLIFGRDRPSDLDSGYGGAGAPECGRIELVVGKLGKLKTEEREALAVMGAKGTKKYLEPNVGADSAKIYISQRADIDKYFGILRTEANIKGERIPAVPAESIGTSAIALKADDVRIIARNTLKIVTNTDDKLANNNNSYNTIGVQIIANNNPKTLEPIPKGEKLKNALEALTTEILAISSVLEKFIVSQRAFNIAVSGHVHASPFFGQPTSPSDQILSIIENNALQSLMVLETNLRAASANIGIWKTNYLSPFSEDTYINSSYNYVN